MEPKVLTCGMESKLADLLLDPESASAKTLTHVAGCDDCRSELEKLRATMDLLDSWEGPEPSPYFLTRLDARMREERQAEPAGWFERLRARFAYGPRTHARPLAAMALTVLLLVGGGAYMDLSVWDQPKQTSAEAAVVQDLQLMDSNAQLLNKLESLSSPDQGD